MPTIAVPSSPEDAELIHAFEENEFDIAGLAELSLDEAAIERAIHELYLLLCNGSEPRRSNRCRLARVLLGMIAVARDDYAGSGHQEYWPFLFDRIEQVVPAVGGYDLVSLRTQPHQSLLGRWFRLALEEFGYTIPEEGQTFVGPVVFHAGIPKNSLPGAMQLIDTAVQQYGLHAVELPYDLRCRLAQNHIPPLHRNVERLLVSRLRGASQLWSCLARVVLAWQWHGDCSEELRQLPPALDPEDVRQALPSKHSPESSRRSRMPLPQIRFDAATGEVRLSVPSGSPSDWRLTTGSRNVDVHWTHTHVGLTAEFLSPPPEEVSISQRGGDGHNSRTIATRPSHWPGIWFHASNGNIEDGATIDANGLEPGCWFVLFEGTPTDWNVPSVYRVPLKWSCFAGYKDWTAWEIEIPTRSQDRTTLEWSVDDNRFHVPLARRPGARVEPRSEPIASAWTASGESVSVFADSPIIRLCRDRSLAVLLLREIDGQIQTVGKTELPPDKDWRIPVSEPGIYQLREARGVGRILLHFALAPGLKVSGPIYNTEKTQVAIEFTDVDAIGQPLAVDGAAIPVRDGVYRYQQSTVEPLIGLEWKWRDNSTSPLQFQWRVEGLRWRVLRMSEDLARWTRETLFVSPGDVRRQDAQFEIQLPAKSDLRVNEVRYSDKLQRGSSGNGITLSLLPFGEIVQVSVDNDEPRPAVLLSDRPLVDRIETICDGDSVLLSWESNVLAKGATIVAWNPLEPLTDVVRIPLTEQDVRAQAVEIPCSRLPSSEWCSVALARSVRIGITRQVLHLAAESSAPNRPVSTLLNCVTGSTTAPIADSPRNWIEFLHSLSLDRVNQTPRSPDQITAALSYLSDKGLLDIDRVFALEAVLAGTGRGTGPSAPAYDDVWRLSVRRALTQYVCRSTSTNPIRILRSAHPSQANEALKNLLRMGVSIGQSCPFKWLAEEDLPDGFACTYPFLFIRDLWLLGTSETEAIKQIGANSAQHVSGIQDRQKAAASRVWSFLQLHDLSFVSQLLPIAQHTALARDTDCGHIHSFALAPRVITDAAGFADALGLEDVALDCHATCDDQFWNDQSTRSKGTWHSPEARRTLSQQRQLPTRYDYSLYWSSDNQQWSIERPGMKPPTCGNTSSPLAVPSIRLDTLIDQINLRQLLDGWAKLDANRDTIACSAQLRERLNDHLCTDSVTGGLHRELITAPQTETTELRGVTVVVATKPALNERARIAWQLAWVERLSAWNGAKKFFADELPTQGQHAEFLQSLREACARWPKMMERCLSLVELLIWTAYRGGLGFALRFSNEVSCHGHAPVAATPTAMTPMPRRLEHFVNQPPSKDTIVTGAVGVIVAYNGRTGCILIKHPSSPSLAATVNAYLQPKSDSHSWLARFEWRAISESDRNKLQELHATKHRGRTSDGGGSWADLMCGMTVQCELRKAHKWEATSMHILFNGQKFTIPVSVSSANEF